MSQTKTLKFSLTASVLISFMTLFQNCSPASFTQGVNVVDVACVNEAGCVSAGASVSESEESEAQQPQVQPQPQAPVAQNPAPAPQPAPAPAPTPSPSVSQPTMYNVVTGYKSDCDRIVSGYGAPVSCTIGGGCGISCGMPSSSCPSANPNLWGACFSR